MTIKTQVNALLGREMNRQEFLKHLAIGLVAMTGLSTALNLIAPKQSVQRTQNLVGMSYGSSAYGGVQRDYD